MNKVSILSTKMLDTRLKQKALDKGISIIEKELIRIEPLDDPASAEQVQVLWGQASDFIFTSANAVAVVARCLGDAANGNGKNLFCIQGKTRELAEKKFPGATILATAPDGAGLGEKILAMDKKEMVFFCGNIRREELPLLLNRAGVNLKELIVYQTFENPQKIEEDFDGMLFFSPSAVSSYFRTNRAKDNQVCFAIGNTTAAALEEKGIRKIFVAPHPDPEVLIDSLIEYYKTIPE